MTKDIKRKGRAVGVKPNNVRLEDKMPVVRAQPTVLQRIVLAWLDKAAFMNLVYSDKKYKELQLEFMLDLESKMGGQFPQEILKCIQESKDVATLLRSKHEAKDTKN